VENLIIVDGYLRFCNGEHIGDMTAHYVTVSHSRGIWDVFVYMCGLHDLVSRKPNNM